MKTIIRIAVIMALLVAGFAAGYPIGQSRGFVTGSEWALVQAEIFVREAGIFMPVNYEDGQFRIILQQPKHLYRNAWKLADLHEDELASGNASDSDANECAPESGADERSVLKAPIAVAER